MPLSVTTRRTGDIPIVVCRGRIVEGAESASLQDQLNKEFAESPLVVLDLREVEFMDSSGLGLLVKVAARVKKEGRELKLCCVSPRIQTILKTTKLNTILKTYASEDDAIAESSGRTQSRKPAAPKADVLCVTSSVDLLAYLEQLLKQAGYAVSGSSTLDDAEMILVRAHPKILVIDTYFSATISGDAALRERFNALIDDVSIVELPPDFASSDAGEAGRQLVKHLRHVLSGGASQS